MTQSPGIPDHLHRALDEIGVVGYHSAKPKRQEVPQDPWWKRGEECPF